MTKREQLLSEIRIAGYHNDSGAFTRLYVENRISRQVATQAFKVGQQQKAKGLMCACYWCAIQTVPA